ncbi:muscular LMNA-interacting protein isoform X2 [Rhinichthys klamathensis goyatoka]|uniref:muscular LMNA-interacting protein isoform X2 n=1 Tax=Rhinichthys klamathensis goyatoka TaxID=3034132 RepID=UPI0024B55209|nr:muscular LMNA-interacting protein isoform X2 [Rhinichthys klamathensis goyatoka]
MALEQPHRTWGKVTTVFATKLKSFTFVPLLKRLPVENRIWKKVLQAGRPNQTSREPGDFEKSMAEEGVYKAEVIYVQELGETLKNTTKSEIQSNDNVTLKPHTTLVGPRAEFGSITPAMETSVNKHPGISHLGFHNTAEVSSGLCLNSSSQREEVLSPASSMDFLTSPASSKESILSEGWDKERSWSALHMFSRDGSPGPFSRTVSPCSSVRSGTFTPSVVRIKRLSLAPGSSLLQMSSVCGTPCDSRTTSPCPLSPRARHRTPPTQLSLLTAILRKGRLPVLSSSSQRPYTPCWPISPVNMSSCLACSAASSVAPMNVSKAKSCTSIDTKSFQISKPQIWKRELVKAPDESPLMKPPERLDSCRHFTSSSGIILPTNHISSPSLPAVQAANAHLPKSAPKGNRLPTVPSSLLCSSNSCMRSPKPSYLSCSSNENHKNPPVSAECPVSMDPNNSGESLIHNDETKPHDRPEKYSLPLTQSQKSSELSNEPYLKHIGRSPVNLDSSLPKLALSSCKSSSPTLKHTFESHINSTSPVLSHKENKQSTLFQNARINDVERVHPSSPSPRPMGLARLSYISPASPACPPVHPSSRSSTPDRWTLSPSPAVPSRQLSPSPSYSFCSSPSPSQWGSTPDCADGDCKNRKTHRIKSTYKALAAIPTNTLLLEQQAIDEDVNKKEASLNPADNYSWEDPHEEMCSPAQLRQQTADLYATIDEVLEDSIQKHQSDHVNRATLQSLAAETSRTSSPSPKLLGRETRYASSPFQPFVTTEKTLTKPGVIRPVTATSRVTDDKHDEEFHPNPFKNRQENKSSRYQYKFASGGEPRAEGGGASACGERRGDSKTRLTSLITQTRISTQDPPISINTQETHI